MIKVAALNEAKVEADAAALRLDAAKETEKLLRFSLSAAEQGQHLSGAGPGLKRLAAGFGGPGSPRESVDVKLKRQLAELAQRAKRDAGMASTGRLRDMLPKVKNKQLAATAARMATVDDVLAALGVVRAAEEATSTRDMLRAAEPRLAEEVE